MIKLRTKKKVHNRKYRTKKYKGGEKIELSLNNIFLPAPDNISLKNTDSVADIAINSLKMYNVNVSKEKLLKNFGVFISLVNDAIKKYGENNSKNFSNDSNQLLREFSKRYDNYELGLILNSLEYLIQSFNNYNNLDKNISKREILDKTYEMVMKIHQKFDKEEEEFNTIYEKIENNNRENQEYYDSIQKGGLAPVQKGGLAPIQKGGLGKIMGAMGKFGLVMGALPVVTQIMTNNFHTNIIEFITGNELMSVLKKILSKIMITSSGERLNEKEEKEKKKSFLSNFEKGGQESIESNAGGGNILLGGKKSNSLTEFIKSIEEKENRFEAHLYLNSFFTGYYLNLDEEKRVWEPYTQMLRDNYTKIKSEKKKSKKKKSKKKKENLDNEIGKLEKNEAEKFNGKEEEYFNKLEEDLSRIGIEVSTTLFKRKKLINLEGGATKEGAPTVEEEEGENFLYDPKKNTTPDASESNEIKITAEGIFEDDQLQRLFERYNDIQSTREQEIKEKQLNKYYETAKPVIDLLGTLYDLVRPKIIENSSKKIEEVNGDIVEPINPFDVVASLMSLMNGQYPDFAMELLPVLMAALPHLKGLSNLMGKKGKKGPNPKINKEKALLDKKKAQRNKLEDNKLKRKEKRKYDLKKEESLRTKQLEAKNKHTKTEENYNTTRNNLEETKKQNRILDEKIENNNRKIEKLDRNNPEFDRLEFEQKKLKTRKESANLEQQKAQKNFDKAAEKQKDMDKNLYADKDGTPQVDIHSKQQAQIDAEEKLHMTNKNLEKNTRLKEEADQKLAEAIKKQNNQNEIERLKGNSTKANSELVTSRNSHNEFKAAKSKADTELGDEILKRNKIHAEQNIDMVEQELTNIQSEIKVKEKTVEKQAKEAKKAEKEAKKAKKPKVETTTTPPPPKTAEEIKEMRKSELKNKSKKYRTNAEEIEFKRLEYSKDLGKYQEAIKNNDTKQIKKLEKKLESKGVNLEVENDYLKQKNKIKEIQKDMRSTDYPPETIKRMKLELEDIEKKFSKEYKIEDLQFKEKPSNPHSVEKTNLESKREELNQLIETTTDKKFKEKYIEQRRKINSELDKITPKFNSAELNLENMSLSELKEQLNRPLNDLLPDTRYKLRELNRKKIKEIKDKTTDSIKKSLFEKKGLAQSNPKLISEIKDLEYELKISRRMNGMPSTEYKDVRNLENEIKHNSHRIAELKESGNLSSIEKIELESLERHTEQLSRQQNILNRNEIITNKLDIDLLISDSKVLDSSTKGIKQEIFEHKSLNFEDSTQNIISDLQEGRFDLESEIYQPFKKTLKSNSLLTKEFGEIKDLDFSDPTNLKKFEDLLEDCRKLQHPDLRDIGKFDNLNALRAKLNSKVGDLKITSGSKDLKKKVLESKLSKDNLQNMIDFKQGFLENSKNNRENRIKEEEKKSLELIDREMGRYNMTGSKSATLQALRFLQTPVPKKKENKTTFEKIAATTVGGGKKTKKNLGDFERKIQKEILKLSINFPKTPRQKQRDLELEAMINIKFRHKISEKVNLSKQELLLDKVLKVFDDKVDKNDTYIKQIKKISEDKKVNYFRYTLLEVGNNLTDSISTSFDLFKNSLMLHIYIREVNTSYHQKDLEFKKKYEDVKSKDEFGEFVGKMNKLMIEEELIYREVKKSRIKLEKTEMEYNDFIEIKLKFENKQNEILDYKNVMKKNKDVQIKEYLKFYEEVRNLKKKEEQLYLYLELIQKNILNYQAKLDLKVKYFVRIQELCKEEIVYIKNEFALAEFLKLHLEKKSKIKLFTMLREMYSYFEEIITALNKFNKIINETLIPILNQETQTIKEEKKFIQDTLDKIKIQSDKNEFIYRMSSKEKIFTIFSNLDFNIRSELNYNEEMINNCHDFMSSIDYEINYIDTEYIHRKIEHKTKRKRGLIDTNNIKEIINSKTKKKSKQEVTIKKNKLINILNEVATLYTRKKQSKRKLKKKQDKNMENIDKIVTDINELDVNMSNSSNIYSKKKLEELRRIKNTKKNSIKKMGKLSKKYKELKDPMELLLEKNIVTKKNNIYQFNKELLKKNGVEILPIMTKKLKNINANMIRIKRIDSDTTYYSNEKNEM